MQFNNLLLTVKGEVAEQRRHHIHDEHSEDGQVGHVLHLFPRAAVGVGWRKNKTQPPRVVYDFGSTFTFAHTSASSERCITMHGSHLTYYEQRNETRNSPVQRRCTAEIMQTFVKPIYKQSGYYSGIIPGSR